MPKTNQVASPMAFNLAAFVVILDRSNYGSRKAFADAVGISAGALHDVTSGRRNPSAELIRRLAAELKCPVTAIIHDPEAVAS